MDSNMSDDISFVYRPMEPPFIPEIQAPGNQAEAHAVQDEKQTLLQRKKLLQDAMNKRREEATSETHTDVLLIIRHFPGDTKWMLRLNKVSWYTWVCDLKQELARKYLHA